MLQNIAWSRWSLSIVAAASWALGGCEETTVRRAIPPGASVDAFRQNANGKVDVLWVVDNSASMVQEQQNLARNFDRFFGYLREAGVDYHIAVATTDTVQGAGRLWGDPQVITLATPSPVEAFARNVQVGVGGNAREAGLDAARRVFEARPAGFLRPDAALFVVFVSDEEDHSEPGTPRYFYRYFESLKGKGNESLVTLAAIVGDAPDGCSSDAGSANPGARYKEVVDLAGGRVGSICDAEFGTILRELGIDAVGLRRRFRLSRAPNPDTLEVVSHLRCNTSAEIVSAACAQTRSTCGQDGGDLGCVVRAKDDAQSDGFTYESSTQTVVLHGAAIPPKGTAVDLIYFPAGTVPETP